MKKIHLFAISILLVFLFSIVPRAEAVVPAFQWGKRIGGTSGNFSEMANSVAILNNGNIVVVGAVTGNADINGDGDSSDGGAESSSGYGAFDVVISIFNSSGTWQWAKRLGGSSSDIGYAVSVDSSNNIVVAGSVIGNADMNGDGDSSDGGAESSSGYGNSDAFISVFNSSGTWQWAKRLGGSFDDASLGVAHNSSGNIFVVGKLRSNVDLNGDGDSSDGGAESASGCNSQTDAFITVFNSSGTWQWAKRLGGGGSDNLYSVVVSSNSNVIVVGDASSTTDVNGDTDCTDGGAESATGYSDTDGIISVFDSSGTWQWAKRMGGTGGDGLYGVGVDSSNQISVAGYIFGNGDVNGDGDSSDGGAESSSGYGGNDGVVSVFNSSGTWQWAKRLGGTTHEHLTSIAVDSSNNIVLTGQLNGNGDVNGDGDATDGGAESAGSYFSSDILLTSFDSSGTWQWAKRLGGGSTERGQDVFYDSNNNLALAGFSDYQIDLSGDGDVDDSSAESTYYGGYDGFLAYYPVDTTGPSVSLTALSPDPNSDTTPTISGTSTDAVSTVSSVQFQMDGTGGSWSSCTADDGTFDEASETFTCTSTSLSNGSHIMYVRSTDSLSNTSGNSSDTFTIDTGGPSVSLTALTPDPTTDTTPTFSGTATDSYSVLSSVTFQVDSTSGNWTACTATDGTFDETSDAFTCTPSTLTQGEHTMYIRATDALSNTTSSGSYASDVFTIDLDGPSITLNAVTPDPTLNTKPTLTGTATDGGLAVDYVQFQVDSTSGSWTDCSADDGTFNELSEAFTCAITTALSEAEHIMYVRSADTSANSSQTSDTFTIDRTPSYLNADFPNEGAYIRQQRPTFVFHASAGSTSQFSSYTMSARHEDGTGFTMANIPVNAPSIVNTRYTITNAGYGDSNSDNDYIYVTTTSSPDWDSSSHDGSLKDGKNSWTMTAHESNGNTVSVGHTFYVDVTKPLINNITTSTLGLFEGYLLSTQTKPKISFILSDNLVPYKYIVDVYRQNYVLGIETGRTLVTSESILPVLSSDQLSIPLDYSPQRSLPYGKYLFILTGYDKAENASDVSTLSLQLLSQEKAEELLKKPVKKETKTFSLPELEKKAILRRQKEARALEVLVQDLKKTADKFDNRITSTVTYVYQPLRSFALSTQDVLGNIVNSLDGGLTMLAKRTQLPNLSVETSPSLEERIIEIRKKDEHMLSDATQKLSLSSEKIEAQFKEHHAPSNRKIQEVFEAASTTLHGFQEPVENIFGLASRVQAGALTFYAIVFDKEPTRISNVTIEEIGTDYVTVSWETNHPATGKVNYGSTLSFGEEVQLTKYDTVHRARLKGLTPGKKYFFEVMSHGKNYTYDSFYTVETIIEEKE